MHLDLLCIVMKGMTDAHVLVWCKEQHNRNSSSGDCECIFRKWRVLAKTVRQQLHKESYKCTDSYLDWCFSARHDHHSKQLRDFILEECY